MAAEVESPTDTEASRGLPDRVDIPDIKGEMLRLRPAAVDDLRTLDDLDAFFDASGITGKGPVAERAIVHEWVRRSVEWSKGAAAAPSRFGDAEARRTIAWSILAPRDGTFSEGPDAVDDLTVIGMIFLIDIDGWSRSARIQVVLGRDFRGRGYSRDAMPRVMTYAFAVQPTGLELHRIWVGVPEKNSRSLSVYQSLGFVPSGTSRDALWDAETEKYQDLVVMDTLVDEYDPIQSLDAFGMHVIEDNPGVREAMCAHEHSMSISREEAREASREPTSEASATGQREDGGPQEGDAAGGRGDSPRSHGRRGGRKTGHDGKLHVADPSMKDASDGRKTSGGVDSQTSAEPQRAASSWPYKESTGRRSEGAWWRNLGRGRKRESGGHDER